MSTMTIGPGDIYCPHCLRPIEEFTADSDGYVFQCRFHGEIQHPFTVDADGRFWWDWDEKHPKPNPGCPWCGTCNISAGSWRVGKHVYWWCNRTACRSEWHGSWKLWPDTGEMRWMIHVPFVDVPWREL